MKGDSESPILSDASRRIHDAWERVRRKGSGGGIDGVSVDDFDAVRELPRLETELRGGGYVPDPTAMLAVKKKGKPSERRALSLGTVRDKVVQQAVLAVLTPRAERLFLDCSYGYRPEKGAAKAVRRVRHQIVTMKHGFAGVADIDDFFGSIDHDLCIRAVHTIAPDKPFLRLVRLWIKMGCVDWKGRWRDVSLGVRQGGVLSPLLANLYLYPFDQSMTMRGLALVRYADDFIVTAATREAAEAAHSHAESFLRRRLNLRLNACERPVVSCEEGFDFLTQESRLLWLARLKIRMAALYRFRGRELTLEGIVASQARALAADISGGKPYRPFIARW